VRRVTPGQGNLKESGTENIPLGAAALKGRPTQVGRGFSRGAQSKGEKVR